MNLTLQPRISSLDVIRGFALLGILSMNIFSFGGNGFSFAYMPLTAKSGLDQFLLMFGGIVCEGKMRGLYSLLFGAGIILATSEKERNGLSVGDYYYRRMLWLLAFGLADAYLLLWRGDILYEYALCGMLLFAFRGLKARYLFLLGLFALFMYLVGVMSIFNKYRVTHVEYIKTQELLSAGKKLTDEQKETRKKWVELMTQFPPWQGEKLKEVKEQIKKAQLVNSGGYVDMFTRFKPDVEEVQSIVFYREFWESLGTILLGMGLMKVGFFMGYFRRRIYLLISLAGIGLGYYIAWVVKSTKPLTRAEFFYLYQSQWYSTMVPFEISRVITTIGYASALMLFCKTNVLNGIKAAFANAGRMALTNYIMQTLICSTLFYQLGFNLYGKLNLFQLCCAVLTIFLFQIVYSSIWMRFFEMGPLEWLWRSLIYKTRLPNRKASKNYQGV